MINVRSFQMELGGLARPFVSGDDNVLAERLNEIEKTEKIIQVVPQNVWKLDNGNTVYGYLIISKTKD